MAFTEALRLVIDADTRGAVQGLEKIGATADRELSRSQSSLDKWGNRLTSVGTGMIAFGGAAVAGLGALARESEQAHLATVKLDNTLSNMPKLAGENRQSFIDLATAIQSKTAADADAIVEGEALLGTFNLTGKQIREITPLVTDYSRKFGIDMADAAVQVGKALDGQVGALKRNGVSIDETLFKTDRYRAVQEALSDQVGGFAEAEGKTFAGSLERMKNQLGDLAEGVGGGAVDAFTTLFGAVDKVAGALEGISPGTQNMIGKIATFGAVGLTAAGGISFLIGQVIKARQNFSDAAEGISSFTTKLGGIRTVAGLAAGAAGLAGIIIALKSIDDAQRAVQLDQFIDNLNSASSAAEQTAKKGILLADAWGNLNSQFDQVLSRSVPAAESFIEIARSAGVSEKAIGELEAKLAAKKNADIGGAAAQDEYSASVQEGADALDGEADASHRATSAAKEHADALRAQFDPLFAAVKSSQALADANAEVTAKEMELAAAIRDHGADSLEAMAAEQELTRAREDATGAAVDQEVALSGLVDMVRQQPGALDEAKAKLQQWVAQGWITQATADATAAKFDEVTGAANTIPAAKNTVVTATDNASGVIRVIQERIDAITGKTVYLNAVASYPVPGYQTFGGRQAGGGVVPYFQSGGVNWDWGQGPRGSDTVPAWLTPGEMILNRSQQANLFAMLNGGGGGGGGGSDRPIEITVISVLDGNEVARAVRRSDRRNGLAGRI